MQAGSKPTRNVAVHSLFADSERKSRLKERGMFIHFEDPCQSLLTVVSSTTPTHIRPTSKLGGTASTVMLPAGLPIVVTPIAEPRSASYECSIPDLAFRPASSSCSNHQTVSLKLANRHCVRQGRETSLFPLPGKIVKRLL